MKICFATGNDNKLNEISKLLGSGFELINLRHLNLSGELKEDHDTLELNSEQKARYIHEKFRIPVFADDTGLEVYSLGNKPGVYSARYAGDHKSDQDNISLLLSNLTGFKNRKARFRTVITFIDNAIFKQFEGIVEGEIVTAPRGTQGFGYDPVFIPDGCNSTFAEMSVEDKNAISHRGRAFNQLIEYLKEHYGSQ